MPRRAPLFKADKQYAARRVMAINKKTSPNLACSQPLPGPRPMPAISHSHSPKLMAGTEIRVAKTEEFAGHQQQARTRRWLRFKRQINIEARQINQARKPCGDENNMKGFNP